VETATDGKTTVKWDDFLVTAIGTDKNLALLYNRTDGWYKVTYRDFTIEQIIEIYASVFSVDWELQDLVADPDGYVNSVVFKIAYKVCVWPKGDNKDYPYQYLTTLYSKSWGNGKFTSDITERIRVEWFGIGNSDELMFARTGYQYDPSLPEDLDVTTLSAGFEIDLAWFLRQSPSTDNFCVISYSHVADRVAIIPSTKENTWGDGEGYPEPVYNSNLSMVRIVKSYYSNSRPIHLASIIAYKPTMHVPTNAGLGVSRSFKTDIELPLEIIDKIDFDYLLHTQDGDLTPFEIQLNLVTTKVVITAGKR